MRWECTECGCRLERPRPPAVCRSCGTAGAVFVEADGGIEEDMEADSMFDSWLLHGMDDRLRAVPPDGRFLTVVR
jgi:hypothetical protein